MQTMEKKAGSSNDKNDNANPDDVFPFTTLASWTEPYAW